MRTTSGLKFVNLRSEALKEGGFPPDVNYFANNVPKQVIQFMKAKFRFCSGCASNLNKATFVFDGNKSHSLTIEHIAQTIILDDSLEIVFPSNKAATSVLDKVWAITSQELIFRYYLKNTHPDVFLVFLPFVHAKQNIQLGRLAREIQYFKSLVDEYFPNSTKFVYMPVYREYEKKKKRPRKKTSI